MWTVVNRMVRFIICVMVLIGIVYELEAVTLQEISIANNSPAVKGADIQLVCNISNFTIQDAVYIYDSRVPVGPLPESFTACVLSKCLPHTRGRYRFNADNTSLYINISNLNRTEDQRWWLCVHGYQRKHMYLTIYTVPKSLLIEASPSKDHDLAQTAVTLQCHTGCIYPQPSITWFYTDSDEARQNWTASPASLSNKTGDCIDSENIYTSTLSLARFMTFPGNVEKSVSFTCGITSFSGLVAPLFSSPSVNVQFAVQVTMVTLKDNANVLRSTDEIETTSGVPKTLECATSASRPAATIVWYIGGTEKQRGISTTFTFTPVYGDNDRRIYCTAFNIQSESRAVSSSNPKLFVKEDEPGKSPVAAIAGGSVGALCATAVVVLVVVVFVRKRRFRNKEERSNDRKLENTGTTESSYCDLTSHYESHQYSQVQQETQFHYETLQGRTKDSNVPNIYEKLQTQNERTPDSTSAAVKESSVTKSETKEYENLSI